MPIPIPIIGEFADLARTVIDKIWPDAGEDQRAQAAAEIAQLQARYAAITAEAQSADPWTSRARPMFMYVFYVVVLFLVIVAPALGVWWPDRMQAFFANVAAGFAAIPEAMWWTFSAGYLGYTGARTWEKFKGGR